MGYKNGKEYQCDLCGKKVFIADEVNGIGEILNEIASGWFAGYGGEPSITRPEKTICPDCVKKIGLKIDE